MFTGLIAGIGEIVDIEQLDAGKLFSISLPQCSQKIPEGGSVAINGSCLSVTKVIGEIYNFVAVAETLSKTTLNIAKIGAKVNFELPATPTTFLDGHMVTGHVDCVGKVLKIEPIGVQHLFTFVHDAIFSRYTVDKGSIAIDGISLTIAKCSNGTISCAVIPETLSRTRLHYLQSGDPVNIEFDVFAKYVDKILRETPLPKDGREDVFAAMF